MGKARESGITIRLILGVGGVVGVLLGSFLSSVRVSFVEAVGETQVEKYLNP